MGDWNKLLENIRKVKCPKCGNTHKKGLIGIHRRDRIKSPFLYHCMVCDYKWDELPKNKMPDCSKNKEEVLKEIEEELPNDGRFYLAYGNGIEIIFKEKV